MLGECGMQEQEKRALRKCSVSLCNQLVVDEELLQMLQADDILTDGMAEGILVIGRSRAPCPSSAKYGHLPAPYAESWEPSHYSTGIFNPS